MIKSVYKDWRTPLQPEDHYFCIPQQCRCRIWKAVVIRSTKGVPFLRIGIRLGKILEVSQRWTNKPALRCPKCRLEPNWEQITWAPKKGLQTFWKLQLHFCSPSCLVCHRSTTHTLEASQFIPVHQAGKLWIPILMVFGLIRPRVEFRVYSFKRFILSITDRLKLE